MGLLPFSVGIRISVAVSGAIPTKGDTPATVFGPTEPDPHLALYWTVTRSIVRRAG